MGQISTIWSIDSCVLRDIQIYQRKCIPCQTFRYVNLDITTLQYIFSKRKIILSGHDHHLYNAKSCLATIKKIRSSLWFSNLRFSQNGRHICYLGSRSVFKIVWVDNFCPRYIDTICLHQRSLMQHHGYFGGGMFFPEAGFIWANSYVLQKTSSIGLEQM